MKLLFVSPRSSLANDVDKRIFGSTVPVIKGEKLSMRILVKLKHWFFTSLNVFIKSNSDENEWWRRWIIP